MEESPADFQANTEDVAESKRAVNAADSIIGFAPDKINKKIYFHLIKGRDFYFPKFLASYYPKISRIVDPQYDNTTFLLSPSASRINTEHQISIGNADDMINEFKDDF